jgi:hypothetical protein
VSLGVSDFSRDLISFIIRSNQSTIVTLEDEVAQSLRNVRNNLPSDTALYSGILESYIFF